MFMGSFGRYAGGNAAALYDRSVYLELANADDSFTRDLKGLRCLIQVPRVSLCLLGKSFNLISKDYRY